MKVNTKSHHIVTLPFPSSPTSPSGGAVGGLHTRRRSAAHTDTAPTPDRSTMLPAPSDDGGLLQDLLVVSGLIAVQIINAGYMVLLTPILALGLKPLFLITFGSLTTSIFVVPFAVAYEKKKWPSRLSLKLVAQFVLIAFGGVTTFQALMLLGIKKTSPAIASTMPNLAPGIIFIIAACLRFEKVDMKCMYSRTKVAGTIVCLTGAIVMSFLQSPSAPPPQTLSPNAHGAIYEDWIVGCLCLLAAVLVVSCSTVLQAATMIDFPAPFTLCAVTSSLGAIFTALVQIMMAGKLDVGTPVINFSTIAAIVILGGMVTAVCIAFQTWTVKKKGPVLVSMFSPIQTVSSAILSAIVLGQVIKLGSLVGMFVMFFGLYMVLWAKKKEGFVLSAGEERMTRSTDDVEKPLLS